MKKLVLLFLMSAFLLSCTKEEAPNLAPTWAFQQSPANGTVNIHPDDVILEWLAATDIEGDELTYSLFMGTSDDNLDLVNTQAELTYDPAGLDILTTYYWSITTSDGTSETSAKDIWSFSTSDGIRNAIPPAPALLLPADGATDIGLLDVVLTWEESIDPDDDVVTYEIYFGTSADNLQNVGTTTGLSFTPSIDFSTTYYWMVKATDPREGEASSTVRSFTSQSMGSLPVALTSMLSVSGYSTQPADTWITTYSDFGAEFSLDGDLATQYISDWESAEGLACPHWVAYDFGELVRLNAIDMYFTSRPDGRPETIKIETKNIESGNWVEVMEVSGLPARSVTPEDYVTRNEDDFYAFELDNEAVCRYFRIYISNTHDGIESYSGFAEVEVR